jgi:hypothetical protein
MYLGALLATRPAARYAKLWWAGSVPLQVSLPIGTKPPRPFRRERQASQNSRYFGSNRASVGYGQRRRPPLVVFECVSAPSKSKPHLAPNCQSSRDTKCWTCWKRNAVADEGGLDACLQKEYTHLATSFLFPVVLANVFEFDAARARGLAVASGAHAVAVVAGATHPPLDGCGAPAFEFRHVCGGRLHGGNWQRKVEEADVFVDGPRERDEAVSGKIWGRSCVTWGSICGPPSER